MVWHDARYAARLLRRQARHSILIVGTMALGIAAVTVLVNVTYAVLLRPLPWAAADLLIEVKETRGGRSPRFGAFTNAALLAWRDQASTIDGIAAWSTRTITIENPADPERVRVTTASADLFPVLGIRPIAGALFQPQQETEPVIVLSETLWRRRFSGDRAAIGKPILVDGRAHSVIGVVADGLMFPDQQSLAILPLRVPPATGNALSLFNGVALLRPGVSPAQAASEGTARGRAAPDAGMTATAIFGGNGPIEIAAAPIMEAQSAPVRPALLVLLVAAGLLLLTAIANVASLQLARSGARRRELAVRAAIGAGSARLVRQLLVENLLLAALGGAAGLALAWGIHRALPAFLPAGFPRATDIGMNSVVVVAALVSSVVAGIAFGVLPALRVRRLDLTSPLAAESGRVSTGAGVRLGTGQVRLAIMVGQIAMTCLLLIGASLLGRSFWALTHIDRGYDPSHVLTVTLPMPAPRFTPERRYALIDDLIGRLSKVGGVTSVGFTSELPLSAGGSTAAFTMQVPGLAEPVSVQASPRIVSPGYLEALKVRITEGRAFAASDVQPSEPVAIVNRAFVRKYLALDPAPLGRQIPMGLGYMDSKSLARIVGIVDDVRYVAANDTSQPEIYYSHTQLGGRIVTPVATLTLRTTGDPQALAADARAIVRAADPGLVADRVATMDERVSMVVARPRLYAVVLGVFAVFALAVAAVGLFGVLSYTVGQRARELAVRAALGAQRGDLVRLVVKQSIIVTAIGLAIGLGSSALLAPSVRALLYGVTAFDPVTFIAVPIAIVLVALGSALGPSLRAARLDPVKELRG